MTSAAQIKANQENSKLSTGPKTESGKQAVSNNGITHGIISNRLLPHENKDEYQDLVDSLLLELKPVGSLESALVEKIAIILWRQKRLVKAEVARAELQQTDKDILESINTALGYSNYGDNKLEQKDLVSVDWDNIEWCKTVIAEIDGDNDRSSASAMKKSMPLTYGQIEQEANEDEQTPGEYFNYLVAESSGIGSWLYHLKTWCQREIRKADDFKKAQQLIPVVRDKLTVQWHQLETFNKYQGSLDNQLFKTMKALREQQEYRLEIIESEASTIEAVS